MLSIQVFLACVLLHNLRDGNVSSKRTASTGTLAAADSETAKKMIH